MKLKWWFDLTNNLIQEVFSNWFHLQITQIYVLHPSSPELKGQSIVKAFSNLAICCPGKALHICSETRLLVRSGIMGTGRMGNCPPRFLFVTGDNYYSEYHGGLPTRKLGQDPITIVPNY